MCRVSVSSLYGKSFASHGAPPWGNNDELWQPRSLLADGRCLSPGRLPSQKASTRRWLPSPRIDHLIQSPVRGPLICDVEPRSPRTALTGSREANRLDFAR
jgi:hypothetical protein